MGIRKDGVELINVQRRTEKMIKVTKSLLHTRNKCISPFSMVKGYLKGGISGLKNHKQYEKGLFQFSLSTRAIWYQNKASRKKK